MRRGKQKLVAGLVGALASMATTAHAGPIGTSLPVLRQLVDRIVIGTVVYSGGKYAVDVEKVVFGSAPIGRLEVGARPQFTPDVKAGERTLLFIDREGILGYAASVIVGPSLEEGIFHIRGFYDLNASGVYPGTMTLAQLEGYFRWGVLSQQVDVTLAFPDGKGGSKPSSSRFTVSKNQVDGTTGAMRLPAKCLEGKPTLQIGSEPAWVTLQFGADCGAGKSPDIDRSLQLEGPLTGVDPVTGAFLADLAPVEPYLDEKELAYFAADPAIANIEQALGVRLDGGSTWTWRLGVDLSPPAGPAVAASGHESGATTDTYWFGDLRLEIAPHAHVHSNGGHPGSILAVVDRGPLEKCELRRPEKPPETCTLVRKPPRWVRIKR